jgi:hypothetical protein
LNEEEAFKTLFLAFISKQPYYYIERMVTVDVEKLYKKAKEAKVRFP